MSQRTRFAGDAQTAGRLKLGRPFVDDTSEDKALTKVSFRVDGETLAALEQLERDAGPAVRGRRSIVLRQLILDASKTKK